jgi:uncharacterized protein
LSSCYGPAVTANDIARALAGGACIGIAGALAWILHGRIAGISGALGRAFVPDGGGAFRLAFLGGLVAVGLVAGIAAPDALGAPLRGTFALAIAGLLVGVGTTVGSGCTSGHGVCGIGRGSKRSLVAVMTFMATAMLTVAIAGGGAR